MSIFSKIAGRARRTRGMMSLRREVKSGFPLAGVPGEGKWRNPKAMIIHDRPSGGYMQGFFGKRAGKTYKQILKEQGIGLDDVYITSAVKTKRGVKAQSEKYEVAVWRPLLERELQLVKPQTLIVVGRIARRVVQDSTELKRYGRKDISTEKEGSRQLQARA